MVRKFLKSVLSLMAVVVVSANAFGQANSKNPYDYAGKIHNEIVIEFLEKHSGKNLSKEEICKIIDEIAKNNREVKAKKIVFKGIDINLLNSAFRDFDNDFRNIINNTNLSEKGKLKTQTFVNYFITVSTKSENPKYSDIYNYVVDFENEVLQDSSLTEKDKVAILSGTSTARYSTYLWNATLGNQPTTTSNGDRIWGWIGVGLADLGGGIIGGVSGGIGGAVETGVKWSVATHEVLVKNEGK